MAPNKSLRIAMLSIHSSPAGPLGSRNTGGMSVYVSELARWLGHSGHQVDIYTYIPGTAETINLHPHVRLIHLLREDHPEVAKEQLPFQLEKVFAALERYRQKRGIKYDLIHSHYWLSGVVGTMARTRWLIPHLITFHTLGAVKNDTTPAENESPGRIARERQLVQDADGIIVPVAGEKVHLITYYGAPGEKVDTIACGVNLDRFQPRSQAAARQRLGMDDQEEVVLYVGRFAPLKGVGVLLEAVALLKARRPRLKVVLVGGDGPAAEGDQALMMRTMTLEIEERVVFAGRVHPDQLADYYAAADFLALPSHYESFGLVVLEALACGTPVLATPVGVAQAVIAEGVNGTLVAGPDAQSVAQGMLRLLQRPADMRPSPARVRATVAQYGWHRTAEALVRRYTRAVRAFAI